MSAERRRRAKGRGAPGLAVRRRVAEIQARGRPWYQWGPFLAERQWGTVREDYSAQGTPWEYFPHDHARSRAYRWSEEGLLGICDNHARLCFALALWNGADPILKERLFGLSASEGNHGEDVKEYYFFLDCTPSHCYMKALYKYPQREFPYANLVAENRRRGKNQPEYELLDTGIFRENRYFDVLIEYAKAAPEDILIRITATNHGPEAAPLHLLPTLWFRNTWSWGDDPTHPELRLIDPPASGATPGFALVRATHGTLGEMWLACGGAPRVLFTENETNFQRLWNVPNRSPFVKDGINDAVVHGSPNAVNPLGTGTKAAAHYALRIAAGASAEIQLRLSRRPVGPDAAAAQTFAKRIAEADAFYASFGPADMPDDARRVQRQAFAGLLWSKQYYHYDVATWLDGDPAGPTPPESRKQGRNVEWRHLYGGEVVSMPDTWEFPWFAAWDLGFHCVPLALVDPEMAKRQLILLLREWYMHPNGQLPAYEWAFGDVNPPVHAWASGQVYKIGRRITGKPDHTFLRRVFHKLLLNFTWWVNRKDVEGRNVFQGGFLGLDNIGVIDRGERLAGAGHIDQADGTAWMGMFCLNMLGIALELARTERAYEDVAVKFLEHFLYIAGALNNIGGEGTALWDDEDEFFHDVLHVDGRTEQMRVRSVVGVIPLLAVETIEPDQLEALPDFSRRLEWFLTHRPDLAGLVSRWYEPGRGERRLFALARGHRMKRVLRRVLDPEEFLSDHGIRSVSRYHATHPYVTTLNGTVRSIGYEPGESQSGLFGGNSNWRGPVWFPINYLVIEALQHFHRYYGDDFLVEHPTGSGQKMTLLQIADDLSRRLTRLFLRDGDGRRPVFGGNEVLQSDPNWRDYLLFHEYFHGDTGAGLGASHQTGWTALVAELLERTGGR